MQYPVNLKTTYPTRELLVSSFIEVETLSRDDFLKVKETLTRIGIANHEKKVLYQSCHVLHKRGRYYIPHFKELFGLDGRDVVMSEEDYARRDAIAWALEKWGLVKLIKRPTVTHETQIFYVLPYKDKHDWSLTAKYKIGKKHGSE